jgi:hypothetical protein
MEKVTTERLRELATLIELRDWHYQTGADEYTHIVRDSNNHIVAHLPQNHKGGSRENAEYIAAANPQAILELLDKIKHADEMFSHYLKCGYLPETSAEEVKKWKS